MERLVEQREQKETPDYKLTIIVHRHGPKAAMDGPLTEIGKEEVADFFADAYEGVANDLPEGQGVDIEHSPIQRTTETAYSLARASGQKVNSIKSDERLSEGEISRFSNLIEQWGGKGGRWMSKWITLDARPYPEVKTGSEAVRDFSGWLLEKINRLKEKGGVQEVDAISHVPVMVAFLARLEERLGASLLPMDWAKNDDASKLVDYLQYVNLYTDSAVPDSIKLNFKGNTVDVPIQVIQELAED